MNLNGERRQMITEKCEAYQMNCEMLCTKCGLQWDVNDPEPPHCNPIEIKTNRGKSMFKSMKEKLKRKLKNNI